MEKHTNLSNRRYQIRLYKFVPLPHLPLFILYTIELTSKTLARISCSLLFLLLGIVILLHGRPSIININNIRSSPYRYYRYVEIQATISYIHFYREVSSYCFFSSSQSLSLTKENQQEPESPVSHSLSACIIIIIIILLYSMKKLLSFLLLGMYIS